MKVDYSKWRLNPDGNILGVVGNFCMNDLLCFIQDYYIEHDDTGDIPEFIDITKEQQDYFISQEIVEGGIKFNNEKLSEIQTPYGVIKILPREVCKHCKHVSGDNNFDFCNHPGHQEKYPGFVVNPNRNYCNDFEDSGKEFNCYQERKEGK